MIKVKISIPGCASNIESEKSSISKFIPQSKNYLGNYQFFINQDLENPEYWFIIDDVVNGKESCTIDKNKIFFLSAEVPFVTQYFQEQKFLNQFAKIF
ncbi:hypothetical protein OAP83_03235, partial [Rickettsiales bacterium]|nr:hypothetical protein [Rickettsiales bacterium]